MFLVLVISCLFTGFLDPSSESEDIAVGTTVDLPYWLAQSLCSRRRNIVTVEIPKIYKEPYRSVVKHDIYTYILGLLLVTMSGMMDGWCLSLHKETATGDTILVGEPAGTRPLETHWL
jgi:hypothetical protein